VLGSGTSMACPRWAATARYVIPMIRTTGAPGFDHARIWGKVVLIDTTPDFYAQAIRERIARVDAVFYTHTHAIIFSASTISAL